jgi:hypothetical protein
MADNSHTTVTIDVETEAKPWIGVGLEADMLEEEGGAFEVAFGKRHVLFWQVSGDPGSSYKITLTPAAGKLNINGEHPIELKIADTERMGGGYRYFTVEAP